MAYYYRRTRGRASIQNCDVIIDAAVVHGISFGTDIAILFQLTRGHA